MRKILLLCVSLFFLSYCAWDESPDVATTCETVVIYPMVADILVEKCSQSGCHDGAGTIGDYSTYGGIQSEGVIDNGLFDLRVFERADMPPSGNPQLTADEFELLRCWSANDFARE